MLSRRPEYRRSMGSRRRTEKESGEYAAEAKAEWRAECCDEEGTVFGELGGCGGVGV